jgi:uncharacterized protein
MNRPGNCFRIVNQDRAYTLATHAQLAGASNERRRGLLGVTNLEEGTGLWIVPCEAIHTFWMKVRIDSIFLDKALRVTALRANLKPFRIAICLRAHSVLELPPGIIEKSGTAVGDQLQRFDPE